MDSTRLLHFFVRSICILILISILWLTVAEHYNRALAFISEPFVPDGRSIQVTDTHIFFEDSTTSETASNKLFSIDALTLHHGLILMCSVILAANGIRLFDKTKSIFLLSLISFCVHVTLLPLLGNSVPSNADAYYIDRYDISTLKLIAVAWGMFPAALCVGCCFFYGLPRTSADKDAQ